MGYFKKPKPETIANRILENKETYKFQIVELKKLVNDKDQSKFVRDMYQALVTGRKITPKMLDSINNIVKRNQPVEREKKRSNKSGENAINNCTVLSDSEEDKNEERPENIELLFNCE